MKKIGHVPQSYADTQGEFTEGNVTAGLCPTILRAEWLNTIQRELIAVIEHLGHPLNPQQDDQLYQTIYPITPVRATPLLPKGWAHAGPAVFPEILTPNNRLAIISNGNG